MSRLPYSVNKLNLALQAAIMSAIITMPLVASAAAAPQAAKTGAPAKAEIMHWWTSSSESAAVKTIAEAYRKAAKERIRRIRDKRPYNDGEKMILKPGSAWMVEGSQEKVSRAYNELIDSSNRMAH